MIATAADWMGTARLPGALAAAGFEVHLLAPEGTYARHSPYTRQHFLMRHPAPYEVQSVTIASAFDRVAPQLLMPCDDAAFDLMQRMTTAPIPGVPASVYAALRGLIVRSLGDPAFYDTSVDKLSFFAAAAAAGARVPEGIVTASVAEARQFAATQGFPVVLKRSRSSGGKGVAICGDADALAARFAHLQALQQASVPGEIARLLVQQFIPGSTIWVGAVAWEGELLNAYIAERVEGLPNGAGSVTRYYHDEAMIETVAMLARTFCASGIFTADFLATGRHAPAWVIEVNRRPNAGTHRGRLIDCDPLAALHDVIEGRPPSVRRRLADDEEHLYVHFPFEWMRDPQSRYLHYHRSDAPIDEPKLFEALFDLGWKVNQLHRKP